MQLIDKIESLKKLKVLVIGDTIIDQYCYSSAVGKSPKDNIIVVKHLWDEMFAGGVVAAANQVAEFCDDVTMVTCLGKYNTREKFIRSKLNNVKPVFFYREDTYTIIKQRFVEPGKMLKLFGVSYLDDYDLPKEVEEEVSRFLNEHSYDLVMVTDFGHGFITQWIKYELSKHKFLAVNTQTNTDNAGFNLVTQYLSPDYICLDEPEIRLACQEKYGKIEHLIESLDCSKVAVTHGQYPTIMYDGQFYKIPVLSNGVKDTTGAGDAFFSVTAPCVYSGFPMDEVGYIGNAVGALKVKIVCNRYPVSKEELYAFLKDAKVD